MGGQVEKRDAGELMSVLLELEPDPELDPEMTERLIRRLRAELAELEVELAELGAGGTAPAGAKAADPVTLGAIVVALSASGGVFTTVIETLQDWLGRSSRRHRIAVTIEGDTLELDSATSGEQRELVEAFVRRHSGDK